jgi:hypothetical protein
METPDPARRPMELMGTHAFVFALTYSRALVDHTGGPRGSRQPMKGRVCPTPLLKKSLDTAQFCVSATHGCDGPITSASASEHLSSLLQRRRLHKRPRRHPFGQSVDATNGKAKAKIPAVLRTLKPPSSTHIRHMLTVWPTIRFAPISTIRFAPISCP